MHLITYIINNELLGSVNLESEIAPRSHAFFCETCGEVWGRIVAGRDVLWEIHIQPCEGHTVSTPSYLSQTPGSILRDWFYNFHELSPYNKPLALELFPHGLLIRELTLRSKGQPWHNPQTN